MKTIEARARQFTFFEPVENLSTSQLILFLADVRSLALAAEEEPGFLKWLNEPGIDKVFLSKRVMLLATEIDRRVPGGKNFLETVQEVVKELNEEKAK